MLRPGDRFHIDQGTTVRRHTVAVKKSTGRWSGRKKAGDAPAGQKKAQSDRKLQREAEDKRPRPESAESKKQPVQAGARKQPEPPLPKQHLDKPGIEADLEPRPRYRRPDYKGSGKLEGHGRPDHRRRLGDRPRGRRAVRARRRRRRHRLPRASTRTPRRPSARSRRRAAAALLIPGDVTDSGVLPGGGGAHGRGARPARHPGQQRRLPGARRLARGHHRRAVRPDLPAPTSSATSTWRGRRCRTWSAGGVDHQHRLGDRPRGQQGPARLLRRPRAPSTPSPSRWRRTCSSEGIRVNCVAPGPVWTPLNPADQDAEKVAKFGAARADEAAGAAGGARAGLRVPRRARRARATSPARSCRCSAGCEAEAAYRSAAGDPQVVGGALRAGNDAHDVVLGRLDRAGVEALPVGQAGELHAVVQPVDVQPDRRHRRRARPRASGPASACMR